MDSPRLLSVVDAQVRYGISKWTWRRWAYEGKIASVKMGVRLMIPVDECERLVREGMRPALGEAMTEFRQIQLGEGSAQKVSAGNLLFKRQPIT